MASQRDVEEADIEKERAAQAKVGEGGDDGCSEGMCAVMTALWCGLSRLLPLVCWQAEAGNGREGMHICDGYVEYGEGGSGRRRLQLMRHPCTFIAAIAESGLCVHMCYLHLAMPPRARLPVRMSLRS